MQPTPTLPDLGLLDFPTDRTSLRISEIAKKLNVSERHVIRWIESGALEAVNITTNVGHGSRFHCRIPVDSYRKFVRARLA